MSVGELCERARAAIGEPIISASVLGGGRNSRVFAVTTATRTVVVKYYHCSPGDPRDRQLTECTALSFLAGQGVTCVPQVLHLDREGGYTILSFIDGERITDQEMTAGDERDVADFVARLKAVSAVREAAGMAPASEAFFSLDGVLANLALRLERLRTRSDSAPVANELTSFLEGRFSPALEELSSRAKVYYTEIGFAPDHELAVSGRVLSPSDFGLHNCVKNREGLVFLDLEYFGWDDPAKLISDFVLHPAQGNVGAARYRVAGRMAGLFWAIPGFSARLRALLPLFALKWCLIALNEFLAGEKARRVFAGHDDDHESVLRRQLGLAGVMLDRAGEGIVSRIREQIDR